MNCIRSFCHPAFWFWLVQVGGTYVILTEQQKESWSENGYLVIENVLSATEVVDLRRSADALNARVQGLTESTDRLKLKAFDTGGRILQQVTEPHELGGEWMALARDARILDVVEDLLEPNILLYYSMLMMKPPHEGFEAPWHQDFAFFAHSRPGRFVGLPPLY